MLTRTKSGAILIFAIAAGLSAIVAAQESNEQAFLSNNHLTDGAELFRLYCASCHGVDGRGDGPAAGAMKRQPPNLTTIARRNGGKFPDARVEHIIDGYEVAASHGSRDMPVWGDFFHDMQRDDARLKLREHNLTQYIRSIQR